MMNPECHDATKPRNKHYWSGYAAGQRWAKSAPNNCQAIEDLKDLENQLDELQSYGGHSRFEFLMPSAESWLWWGATTWNKHLNRDSSRRPQGEMVHGFIEGALDMWIMTPWAMDWPEDARNLAR